MLCPLAKPTGMGLTMTVAVVVVPVHPLEEEEVTVKVTVTGALVVLASEPLMSVVPLAAIPVTVVVLFRLQLYEVAIPLPEPSTMVVIGLPEQMVWVEGVAVVTG
jgi:hypothetical protein